MNWGEFERASPELAEPPGPFHLFAIEVQSAGFVVFSPERYAMAWDPDKGLRCWEQRLE